MNMVGTTDSRIASVARAIGRVLGIFRRLFIRKPEATGRNALQAEIAKLESELDRIYALVARRAGSRRRVETGAAGLDPLDLLYRARDLKKQLREKRAKISRPYSRLEQEPPVPESPKLSSSRRGAPPSPRVRAAALDSLAQPGDGASEVREEEEGEVEFESLLDGDPY